MTKNLTLTASEREFFRTVAQAAFTNPFSQSRIALDRSIAACSSPLPWEELVERATTRIDAELTRLRNAGRGDLERYGADDRDLLRTAFLFNIYHRYRIRFDEFILKQQAVGDKPLPLPFARELLAAIAATGLSEAGSHRYLGIFYQIRRAFYFIETSLAGLSPAMHALRLQLWNNIFTCNINWYEQHLWDRMEDFSTLLLGETGTGKGAAAAAIGRSGFIPFDPKSGAFAESFTRNFVSINLSQYPESLLESELFGHRKGAFTGAVEHHEGIFSRCPPHGSIFLDEIGDVAMPVQVKLLQVLQERNFSPVGSHEKLRFHGRVIAATNRPLDDLRCQGTFREDFYYRLCSDIIIVPPLRQRVRELPGELEALIASILGRLIGAAALPYTKLVRDAIVRDVGKDHPWPGNVRELEQAVKRIILTGHYHVMQRDAGMPDDADRLTKGLKEGALSAEGLLTGYCAMLYKSLGSYEEVSRRTELDRRTVKKYVQLGAGDCSGIG